MLSVVRVFHVVCVHVYVCCPATTTNKHKVCGKLIRFSFVKRSVIFSIVWKSVISIKLITVESQFLKFFFYYIETHCSGSILSALLFPPESVDRTSVCVCVCARIVVGVSAIKTLVEKNYF